MPINRDLGDLPPADTDRPDTAPVPNPKYGPALARAWHELLEDSPPEWADAQHRWRAHWSAMCARAVSYEIIQRDTELACTKVDTTDTDAVLLAEAALDVAKPTNPPSMADSWRFGLGKMVHEGIQAAVAKAFPGSQSEVIVTFDGDGVPGGGHADIVHDEPVHTPSAQAKIQTLRTVVEVKTINGFGFKTAATTFKGWPEGPRGAAIVQGAVNAHALHADLLVILYLSLELLSPDVARRNNVDEIGRFTAEWWYERDQFEPIARAELKRVGQIFDLVDNDNIVPRQIPDLPHGARITDPGKGLWVVEEGGQIVDTGSTWHCSYCRWRDRCIEDEA